MSSSGWFGVMAMAVMISTASLATALIWVTTTDPLWLVAAVEHLLALVS